MCVWFVHGMWWRACYNERAKVGFGGKYNKVLQSVLKWSVRSVCKDRSHWSLKLIILFFPRMLLSVRKPP